MANQIERQRQSKWDVLTPKVACTLPTQMADDPPLDDVVAKTYEWGFRNSGEHIDISGAIYLPLIMMTFSL